jgi:hypothetical protein
MDRVVEGDFRLREPNGRVFEDLTAKHTHDALSDDRIRGVGGAPLGAAKCW